MRRRTDPHRARPGGRRVAWLHALVVSACLLGALPALPAAAAPAAVPLPALAGCGVLSPLGGALITGEEITGGGGRNEVVACNRADGALRVRANLQLNHVPAPTAAPANLAYANSACAGCRTFAVALQLNLISAAATSIAPRNTAVAVNVACAGCTTVARAIQYTVQVADPTQVPPEVAALVGALDGALRAIASDPALTLPDAEAQLDAVLAQFQALAPSLSDQRSAAPGAG